MPVIPALRRLRQEDQEFEASLGVHSELEVSLGYVKDPISPLNPQKDVCVVFKKLSNCSLRYSHHFTYL
jgi:hypothetical protein